MNFAVPCLMLLSTVAVLAQTPPNLLGITLNNSLIHQSLHAACTPLGNCPTGLLPTPLNYWPGGSAWDPVTSSTWATTGTALGRYADGTCVPNCGPVPCPRSPGSQATGLDVHDGWNELWTIDSLGMITRSNNNCALGFVNSHNTGLTLAPGPVATSGITIDELRGLVFYSTCDYGAGSGTIYVAPLSNPGAWFQSTPVADCFTNPSLITGLAVDAGNANLYWTNGRGTFNWTYTYNPAGPSVAFTPGTCCIQAAPFTDPYTDLSIKWGGATSSGAPCANGTCLPCPMTHLLRNAPLLGTTLQLGLDSAQVGMPTWCIVGVGSCSPGGTVPGLCGTIMVPLGAISVTLPMQFPAGGIGCTGSTTWLLPLPSSPGLVGLPMASQCVGLCPPVGTAMSNCLSFVLQ